MAPMNPRLLRPTGQFDPRRIAGLQGWWDASDLSTMAQNSNGTTAVASASDPVGYWADKSGNGRHAKQTTNNNRPQVQLADLNGRPGLNFDGSDDFMGCDPGAACVMRLVFAVMRRTGSLGVQFNAVCGLVGPTGSILVPNSAYVFNCRRVQTLDERFLFGKGTSDTFGRRNGLAVSFVDSGAFGLFHAQFTPNTTDPQIIALEGVSAASATSGLQYLCIGADASATGRMYPMRLYEMLMYDTLLPLSEVQRVERYLSSKWGIALA